MLKLCVEWLGNRASNQKVAESIPGHANDVVFLGKALHPTWIRKGFSPFLIRTSFKAYGPAWGQKGRPHGPQYQTKDSEEELTFLIKHSPSTTWLMNNDSSLCVIMCAFLFV